MIAYKKRYPLLRKQLKSIGMTYAELAYHVGKLEPHVKRIMTGQADPRVAEACKMLMVAGLPVSMFMEVFINENGKA